MLTTEQLRSVIRALTTARDVYHVPNADKALAWANEQLKHAS